MEIAPASPIAASRGRRTFPDSETQSHCPISFHAPERDTEDIASIHSAISQMLERIRAEETATDLHQKDMILSNIDSLTGFIPKHRPDLQGPLVSFRNAMSYKMFDPSTVTNEDKHALWALHEAHSKAEDKLSKPPYDRAATTPTLFSTMTATELMDIEGSALWDELSGH